VFFPHLRRGSSSRQTDAVWISYASFIRYGYQLLTHNEFHGLKFTCANSTQAPMLSGFFRGTPPRLGDMGLQWGSVVCGGFVMGIPSDCLSTVFVSADAPPGACIETGDQELALLFPSGIQVTENFFILLGMVLGLRFLSFLALHFTRWEKR
jgi:hypothetical protein